MQRLLALVLTGLTLCAAGLADAQVEQSQTPMTRPTLNFFGLPGLIDTPTATALSDGMLGVTASRFADQTRVTLAFQVLPRVTATFRYAILGGGFTPDDSPPAQQYYYDRSFDIHWLALPEGGWWPALGVGIRDLVGTGIYGSEYLVATRHFGADDQLAVTAGLGWGRLGQRNPLGQPFGARPPIDFGRGGSVDFGQFFRGDAAFFGGLEWQATDRLRLQVEYSPDLYRAEVADGLFRLDSPINLGASYRVGNNGTLGLHYLYGTTLALSYNALIDPRRPAANTLVTAAPNPVVPRPRQSTAYSTAWTAQPDGPAILRDNIMRLMAEDGLEFVGLALEAERAVLRVRNTRFQFESMALGRAMRILSITMPPSVEVFEVVFVVEGMDVSRIRMTRSDIEAQEHAPDGAAQILERARIEDATRVRDPGLIDIRAPEAGVTWGIAPYVETQLFDPSAPVRADLGLRADASYSFGSGFVAEGELRARLTGTLDEARQVAGPVASPTAPFPVRTDAYRYLQESDVRLQHLTLSHYGRPARNLYSRVSLGYLERMFAGLSTELLWRPVDSRIGIGVEVNHVRQRAFDGGLGLRDYDITMGHVSAYVDLGENFEAQVDTGRYLAGDYGATLRLSRVFGNGWRLGAFATLTDVSFEDFGEGSFDKGITLEIPLGYIVGSSTREQGGTVLRPLLRDGGATLNLRGRLNALVTDYHRTRLHDTGGMIWR